MSGTPAVEAIGGEAATIPLPTSVPRVVGSPEPTTQESSTSCDSARETTTSKQGAAGMGGRGKEKRRVKGLRALATAMASRSTTSSRFPAGAVTVVGGLALVAGARLAFCLFHKRRLALRTKKLEAEKESLRTREEIQASSSAPPEANDPDEDDRTASAACSGSASAPPSRSTPTVVAPSLASPAPTPAVKGAAWGRAMLFFLVLVALLELARQVSFNKLDLHGLRPHEVASKGLKAHHYLILSEKAFCLSMAWYLTAWASFLTTSRGRETLERGVETASPALEAEGEAPSRVPASAGSLAGGVDFTGIWIRDRRKSDSLAGVCQLAGLNRFLAKAICLVRGSELVQTEDGLSIRVFSEIPWFTLRERYTFNGHASNRRRDFRGGRMDCTMERTATGLKFLMKWPEVRARNTRTCLPAGAHPCLVLTFCMWLTFFLFFAAMGRHGGDLLRPRRGPRAPREDQEQHHAKGRGQ